MNKKEKNEENPISKEWILEQEELLAEWSEKAELVTDGYIINQKNIIELEIMLLQYLLLFFQH